MKRRMRNSGMALMEVLILSSVGIVTLLAFSAYLFSQQKVARDIAQKVEASIVKDRITDLLSDTDACINTFGGLGANSDNSVSVLKDASGGARFSVGDDVEGGMVSFLRVLKRKASPYVGPNSSGQAEVQVDLHKRGSSMGSDFVAVKIPLIVDTNAGGQIQSCSSVNTIGGVRCRYIYGGAVANCPANYEITGGGIYTTDMGKGKYFSYPTPPPGGAYGTGAWNCKASGSTGCYAICCLK